MRHQRSWLRGTTLGALLVAVSLAVGGTAASAGSSGGSPRQVGTPKNQVTTPERDKQLEEEYAPTGISRQLARTKDTLDKYRSVDRAKADGYLAASPCESTPINPRQTSYGGGMGIHYVNTKILASGTFDPAKPPVLLYAPQPDGSLNLVAVEYFKPDADQNVQTDGDRPSLFGRAFDGPMQGHAPGMPIHFDLHV